MLQPFYPTKLEAEIATKKAGKGKLALVLGGGAPNATLMAGALAAFAERRVEFDVISTSGAGALIGLLYMAPKQGNAVQALAHTREMGVADLLYRAFPVNFKVFNKPGTAADMYRDLLAANPFVQQVLAHSNNSTLTRLAADWLQLMWATLCPSDLSNQSLGLCAHVPFVEQLIDFEEIAQLAPAFYINAYNLTQRRMDIFDKRQITPEHFRAALSFPFIYPPYRLGEDDYIEGAAIDCLNFKALVNDDMANPGCETDIKTIVVFDILGSETLLRKPRDLYDAWVLSIITPLVEVARDDLKLFEYQHNRDGNGQPKRKLLKVPLMSSVPVDQLPDVLDWSSSNLNTLYQVGYEAGVQFCNQHAAELGLQA
jgi:NTE family protein